MKGCSWRCDSYLRANTNSLKPIERVSEKGVARVVAKATPVMMAVNGRAILNAGQEWTTGMDRGWLATVKAIEPGSRNQTQNPSF